MKDVTPYVLVPDAKRKKPDKKSSRCIFVGYSNNSEGYKLYNPETKMLRSRDVIVLENSFTSELMHRETQVNGGITFIMPLLLLPIPKNQRVSMKLSMERIQSSGKKQLTVNMNHC